MARRWAFRMGLGKDVCTGGLEKANRARHLHYIERCAMIHAIPSLAWLACQVETGMGAGVYKGGMWIVEEHYCHSQLTHNPLQLIRATKRALQDAFILLPATTGVGHAVSPQSTRIRQLPPLPPLPGSCFPQTQPDPGRELLLGDTRYY